MTGANAEHVHLTHMHLRTWAAAIVVFVAGYLFDPWLTIHFA